MAGVALVVLTNHRVRGLDIDQHTSTLPLKKGLSSSAAICVLTARAFSECYGLKLTTRGEMEYAYLGEVATGSCCGRMDQACAFGSRPTLLTHDGDRLECRAHCLTEDASASIGRGSGLRQGHAPDAEEPAAVLSSL